MTRRVAAVAALVFIAAAVVLALVIGARDFPRGLPVVACGLAGVSLAWHSVLRSGTAQRVGLAAGGLLFVAACVLILVNDRLLEDLALLTCLVAGIALGRIAFAVRARLPAAPDPRHPVLFWNPKSGGGKATRFHLEDEAHARGIETVELRRGDDLEALARAAVARGADALAVAGGDGSQAVVARVAAGLGLPYACVPAGTRNHFALDLGVDRNDVVGALDAFAGGGERRVDLAEVNGRVFVNNVSLGVYADAVQQSGYREAKIRTLLETAGSNGGNDLGLHWTGPDGNDEGPAPAVLVSNNAYRLGRAVASGTRPRVDAGVLGIAVFDPPGMHGGRPWHEWTAPRFEIDAIEPVNAGIDGEAAVLTPPLRFESRPRALRVRIAAEHPGASPSARLPDGAWAGMRALVDIALGREAK